MNHLIEFGVKGFRAGKTLFPDWAAYVVGQCRENGYDQQEALRELKSLYAQLLASPASFGFSAYSIQQESRLAEVRHFDLQLLPVFDGNVFNEMVNELLAGCFEDGRVQFMTIQDAQARLLSAFPVEFHSDIKNCMKSVYASLSYHPGTASFFVSPIEEVDAYNPLAPRHFTEEDKSILEWVQHLLCRLKGVNEYNSMDSNFTGRCDQFSDFIDELLVGRLEHECIFNLDVTPNKGLDNYSVSLRFAADFFEFSLHARGIDNADERYSESVMYWYVDPECIPDEIASKINLLPEYEYWFVDVGPDTKITSSFSVEDENSYEFTNRPKQLDLTALEDKECIV